MAFWDFLRGDKRENAVQLNPVDTSGGLSSVMYGWEPFKLKRGQRPFAATYLWIVLDKIFGGLSNITYQTTRGKSVVADAICSFVDTNINLLFWKYITNGYVVVSYTKDYHYAIPNDQKLQLDQYGRVINRNCVVIYSQMYETQRKTPMFLCRPLLDLINQFANTLVESCGTLGVLPILSGNSIPASPKFKEELAEMMTKKYGWGDDQLRYFLSQQELKVDSVDLKLKDLELRQNLESSLEQLLYFWNVPKEIVCYSGTYANMSEARKFFYESCVRGYAEVFLKVAQGLLTASDVFLPKNTITYKLTNVPDMETTLSETCRERGAYIDALLKLKGSGVDVQDELNRVYEDLKRDYINV